jgi:hypothetical protein
MAADLNVLATANVNQNESVAITVLTTKRAINAQETLAAGLLNAIPPAPAAPVSGSVGHNINTVA